MDGVDPYKVLGLPRNFTYEQLRGQFKRLVHKHHPDKNMEDIKSTPNFQILAACYKMLLKELDMREADRQHYELRQGSKDFLQNQAQKPALNTRVQETGSTRGKFDLQRFNQAFDEVRLKDQGDDGYGKWMNSDDSFHKRHNQALIKYKEPEAIVGSKKLGNFYELGNSRITDFSGANMTNKNLNYMDLRIAHTTHTLVDERVVDKRKEYRTVGELESDRANVEYVMSPAELRQYHAKIAAEEKREKQRLAAVARRDAAIEDMYNRANKLLLGMRG